MPSLKSRGDELASPQIQMDHLHAAKASHAVTFADRLKDAGLWPLRPTSLTTLQVNLGKMCNQTCAHCHVDAGPDRREIMTQQTMQDCLRAIETSGVEIVDLTGGAPEMNPHFRWFVEQIRARGAKVLDRCNLTIILANQKYHDLPDFFAQHQVEVVSSLPHFSPLRTDRQRGEGVFGKSIEALRRLNAVGYGCTDTGLVLNLVHNPTGAFLSGCQEELEREYKQRLEREYGVVFNQLYCLNNMPISRFLEFLIRSENLEGYMQALIDAFNPVAARGVMCRSLLSVGWDGRLYDCDFNQMLDMEVASEVRHISDFHRGRLLDRAIRVDQHCFGCTAGSGSSCGGATA